MDLDFAKDAEKRRDALLISSTVLVSLAVIIVLLRCIGRCILLRMAGYDDYFMVGAMTGVIGYLTCIFIAKENGMGVPMTTLTLPQMTRFLQLVLAVQLIYYFTIFCIKVSICFTYLRFAVSNTFRYLCIGTIGLHSVFAAICLIVTATQCRPLEKMWDMTGTVQGSCIDTTAFFYATSSFNILTDIWILLLPLPTLRKIHRPGREKVALFAIFGVGAFAAAASMVRLHSIRVYTQATDPFLDSTPVNLWSMIEMTVGIICGSVSAVKPILSRKPRSRSQSTRDAQQQGQASKLSALRRRREQRQDRRGPDSITAADLTLVSVADNSPRPTGLFPPPSSGGETADCGNGSSVELCKYESKGGDLESGRDDDSHIAPAEPRKSAAGGEVYVVDVTGLTPQPGQSPAGEEPQGYHPRSREHRGNA